ncbi:hypothetical protein ACFPES_25950 [Paenibacillus sp. GCM10023248]|uniref:hypothetical protein n=1 Tax=Bacillales TaxID=1385 RepID=UPI002379F002|nr:MULTISPECIES: hypothetical protein [Bacillales]MDD9270504.1 hypothetical protein [Paenibacillus sp. MAHUQ-63]MDR6884132.1 hypothetical protein [Bacillus sp. 3255]
MGYALVNGILFAVVFTFVAGTPFVAAHSLAMESHGQIAGSASSGQAPCTRSHSRLVRIESRRENVNDGKNNVKTNM